MSTGSAVDVLRAEAERLAVPLGAAALEAFARYLELLRAWEGRAGLTSVTEPEAVVRRHFAESLALYAALRDASLLVPGEALRVVDVGSGAGLPGVPLRIVDPALGVTLVEANGRRCAFLQELVAALALDDVEVVQARAEEAGRDPALRGAFDLVVARAVAPLPVLVEYTLPLLRSGGLLAAPKGSRAREELADAAGAITALGGRAEEPLALPLPADAPPQLVVLVRREGELAERFPRRPGIPAKRPLR